jgi:hypothetical protein
MKRRLNEALQILPTAAWTLLKRSPPVGFACELWWGPTLPPGPYRLAGAQDAHGIERPYLIEDALGELPDSDFALRTPDSPWYGLPGYDSA